MNLLITGAWQQAKDYIGKIENQGHQVRFLQYEKDELPCEYEWVEGLICNGLFLSHTIERFTNLKYIQLTSAGFDRVPMDYVKEHEIAIYNARGVYSTPMAEYAIAGVLELYKCQKFFTENQKKHSWEKKRDLKELAGQKVCILGCGSVGTECARRFKSMECTVYGVDVNVREDDNYSCVYHLDDIKDVISKSDIVIVTLLLTNETIEMIMYWFHAKLMSKYVSIVSLIAYAIVSVYKIVLLATKQEVYWFAISYALDYSIIGFILNLMYKKFSSQPLEYSLETMRRLFSKGKYYIISGLMVVIYAQTDRIMLKIMMDETAVGYYSAGVTCAAVASFVFSAIITSMQPVIYEGKKQSTELFETRIRQLYSVIVYIAVLESVVFSVFSEIIVKILYGSQYEPTIGVLRIIAWYTAFSYYGGAKDIWILAKNKQKYLVWLNGAGAMANIILNYLFIPIWGINGAAFASLITQVFTNLILGFIIKELRRNNYLLLQSLNPQNVVFFFKRIQKILK